MAFGKKKTVLMKAVSEMKDADYSQTPELGGMYKRLSSGRKQFTDVLDKNIKAVMLISSLDLTMQHHTEQIMEISRSVAAATESIFGAVDGSSISDGRANNQQEELTNTIISVSEEMSEVYKKIEVGQDELTAIKELSKQTIQISQEMQRDMNELFEVINQIPSDYRHFPADIFRHFTKHQALSRIVQHRAPIAPHLLQYPVGKPPKTEHINIHNPLLWMSLHQIHLCLHRKLVRHNHEKIRLWLFHGTPYHFIMQLCTLPRPRSPEVKSKSHTITMPFFYLFPNLLKKRNHFFHRCEHQIRLDLCSGQILHGCFPAKHQHTF